MDGDARRIAEEAGAAIYVEPEDASALASAILHLYENHDLTSTLGPKGRRYVEAWFDYDRLTALLSDRIVTLLDEYNSDSDRDRESMNTSAASPLL